ncbi:MAG: hypothetical protein C0595_14565 [Marinilabiliales bacterium]|nr:MAG: hypothetical protein C0595_14565 [Marinilabiliales bacterium]
MILLLVVSCNNNSSSSRAKNNPSESSINTDTIKATVSKKAIKIKNPKVINSEAAYNSKYKLRKYSNVKSFYKRIARPAIQLCLDNNVPPAAILAIAGLESGWNQGYIGRITGNILSLGNRRGDKELPALLLPKVKSTGEILIDSLEIIKYTPEQIEWENRPPSLKKDYRPAPWGGTKYKLAYFKYHPEEKAKAQIKNINDFVTIFISRNSRISVYRKARHMMDSLVEQKGKEVLLKEETAILFINQIGGKPNSFNFRKTWPKKVTYIIKNAGLAELTKQMNKTDKEFDELW